MFWRKAEVACLVVFHSYWWAIIFLSGGRVPHHVQVSMFQSGTNYLVFLGSSVILTMNQIEIYQTKDKQTRVEVSFEEDTVWLNQAQMVDLFVSSKQNISHHIRQIYKEGELKRRATVKKYLTVQKEANRMVSR
jgi:hypothetical protein